MSMPHEELKAFSTHITAAAAAAPNLLFFVVAYQPGPETSSEIAMARLLHTNLLEPGPDPLLQKVVRAFILEDAEDLKKRAEGKINEPKEG